RPGLTIGQIASGDDFVDRVELLSRLWQRLPTGSVELVAPRRFGKTSVMKRLQAQPRDGYRVLFLDCEAYQDPYVLVEELYAALLKGQARASAKDTAGKATRG